MFLKIITPLILGFFLFVPKIFAQIPCTHEPNYLAMNQEMMNYFQHSISSQNVRIAIFPFQDQTNSSPDPTLAQGFAVALIDILSKVQRMGIYPSLLTLQSSMASGIPPQNYFVESSMAPLAQSLGATHAIIGMFQKTGPTGLRYFVKIIDVRASRLLSPPQEFASEMTDRFLDAMGDTAKSILKTLNSSKIKVPSFEKYLEQNPSYEAFRYYVKGIEKSLVYNPADLAISRAWFEKATAASYTFNMAYMERIRVLMMLALIDRLQGKDISLLVSEAQKLLQMSKTQAFKSGGSSKKNTLDWPLSGLRLFLGYEFYVTGVGRFNSGQREEASHYLSEARRLVPEDALARAFLAKTGGRASEEMMRATNITNCLP